MFGVFLGNLCFRFLLGPHVPSLPLQIISSCGPSRNKVVVYSTATHYTEGATSSIMEQLNFDYMYMYIHVGGEDRESGFEGHTPCSGTLK